MKRKCIAVLLALASLASLTGCGDKLTEEEQKISGALKLAIEEKFIFPETVEVVRCGEIFTHENQKEYSCQNGIYYPLYNANRHGEYVLVQLEAETRGGDRTRDVYCLYLSSDPAAAGLWSYENVMDMLKEYENGDDMEQLTGHMIRLDFLEEAQEYGCSELAESGSYPIVVDEDINVDRINKDLQAYWE